MKKTAIANWGNERQGKSSTVKEIAKIILSRYPNAVSTPFPIDFTGDITVIIAIGNIKIGIESQGDPGSRLPKSLDYFIEKCCDLIVCSTRTSGKTVVAVDSLHNDHDYDIIWVTNYRSEEKSKDVLNNLSAEHIFDLIQQLISGKI